MYPVGNMFRFRDAIFWTLLISTVLYGLMATWFMMSGVEAIDDAYISLRYARNLVSGTGLVYNPGEYVQGYTNFLWVMLYLPWPTKPGSTRLPGSKWGGAPCTTIASASG